MKHIYSLKFNSLLGVGALFTGLFYPLASQADEILCERAPTAYLVTEIKPSQNSKSICNASAKIQAIAYECGDASQTFQVTQEFHKANVKKAREKCEEFCKSVSPTCRGKFQEPSSCGFTIPSSRATDTGINVVGCPKHCKGQAFNYCSIYHANFFSTDPDLFKDKPANCYCLKR